MPGAVSRPRGLKVTPGHLGVTLGLGSTRCRLLLAGESQDPLTAHSVKPVVNLFYYQLN